MILVKIQGGLGNQMFQYACARALSLETKDVLLLDTTWYKHRSEDIRREFFLSIFNAPTNIANKWQIIILNQFYKKPLTLLPSKWQRVILKKVSLEKVMEPSDHKIIDLSGFKSQKILLNGFWQSEKYFKKYNKQIRKDFSFKNAPNDKLVRGWMSEIKQSRSSVSLHIRRGDYANNPKTKKYHGLLSMNYFLQAVEKIKTKVKNPTFFIFSDDIEWVKTHLKITGNVRYLVHRSKDWEDLRLMSQCKHNIIANSSFSWWGAWLNIYKNKIVIAPKRWYATDKIDSKDIVPKSWIRI